MKRILVPTDFSPQAENALKVAAQLAKKHNGVLFLLHTMEIPINISGTGDKSSLPESLYFIKLAEKNFMEMLNKPYLNEMEVHQAIGHGEIYDDVAQAIKKNKIDLVVMGSHGANGFKEMFVGSNAEKVVRTSTIPVLVIKNEHVIFNVDTFIFATDFSEEYRNSFNEAQKFAKKLKAKIHLLYVNTPNGFKTSLEAKMIMNDFVSGMAVENYKMVIYNDSSVEKGILNYAQEIDADLIGMSTHGRKGLAHFFNGSISEDLVNHANMPVVTFKIK